MRRAGHCRPRCAAPATRESRAGPRTVCIHLGLRSCFNVSTRFKGWQERGGTFYERSTQLAEPSCAEKILLCIELLQGKRTVHILCAMRARLVRLSKLRREIPSASKKSITARLRYLEAARVVVRRDISSSVLHVEYELADPMREPLGTLLDLLAEWGEAYSKQDSAPIEHPESSKI